ncbi:MAG: hypothetical protein NTV51_15715, partial [Verrucomicrobia bacterium]|nr:hypothetical protein [Verrucomicrobiota bacterium]
DGTPPPAPDPGIVSTHSGPIDVRDLNRIATTGQPLLSAKPAPNKENEIHGVLRDNLAVANAAGLNEVTLDPNYVSPRQKRIRRMWIIIVAADVPLVLLAWKIGPGAAIPFVCALGAIGMVTGIQIFNTFFLNTD